MKIKTSTLTRLTRLEVFQLIADALVFANALKEGMTELYVTALALLQTKFEAYDQALLQERASTPKGLIEAEEARDYGVRKLQGLLDEYADYRLDDAKAAAANALLAVMKPYGTGYEIARMSQDSETAAITNLLQDFDKEPNKAHLTTLGFQPLVNYINENNTVFAQAQQTRRDEQSKYIAGLVKTTREEVQNAFRTFSETVNALAIVEGEDKYATLTAQLNTLIDAYIAKAKQRQSSGEDNTDETSPITNAE